MSRPRSSMRPAVGRQSPESRLKSVVFPAPFGPMMPSNSPSATSSETSATIFAPPMSSPRLRVARTGGFVTRRSTSVGLREWMDGRLDVPRRNRLDPLRLPVAVVLLEERDDEHRLDQRVVSLADPRDAFRPEELPALERRDHLVDVVTVLLHRVAHHQCRVEAVGREEVGRMAGMR